MREDFKSGFVAIIGRPNVGKSTLMNHLIGQKIAITSRKPQTTRNRIQTVYTDEQGQIVFLDTPGIHQAKNKLGEYMVSVAERTLREVDVILWLVEPSTYIGAGEQHIAEQLKNTDTPVILVINKIDTVEKAEILTFIDKYKDVLVFIASAHQDAMIKQLEEFGKLAYPSGEQFFKRAENIRKRLDRLDKVEKPVVKKDIPIITISEVTGKTVEEIEALKEQI